jgi:CRISPR/Cas system-associated exonuclease Cas4 (RecB family)
VELFEHIRDRVDDPNTHFVFPSELTARFWCKRALNLSERKSIPTNRFLSWDQFKESCFVYASPGRPVNRAVRLLFLNRQLEQNRREPFLRQIVPPQYAGEPLIFLESLQRLLPVLHRLADTRTRWPRSSRDKLIDLEGLYARYRAFLDRSQLYEPSYEKPRFSPGNLKHILFFPELIEDYGEYADLLSNRVERIPVPPDLRPGTSVRVFQTLPEEIRAAIRQSAALLDGGVDPEQIILTVGQLRELEPLLRREAELFSLPLQIHLGKPLSEFPQVTMLHKAYTAVQSSFSLHTMKALLLCRSIPWKQEKLCRALIRLALDCRIVGNTADADNWASSIESSRRMGNPRKLPLSRVSGFYSTLMHRLIRIEEANTFAELKSCLVSFVADFLDLKRLDEEEVKIFQFAIDTLDELHDELVGAGADAIVGSRVEARGRQRPAFPIWWLYLGQRLYVPGRYGAGIPVYPFRVSAGMEPEHHIVINASQAATSHTIRRYPFLKLHEEQDLSETQRELAPVHLQLYSHSGRNVLFSYARRDFQRSNLAPPLFLARDIPTVEITAADPADAYDLERRAWIDGTSFPLQEVQKIGYEAAAVGALGIKEIDAARQNLRDAALIRALEERLRDAEGRFRISATALERFSLCPFQFLWERLLGVSGEEYEPSMIDPIELGVLLHRGLELFFAWVQSEDPDHSGALAVDRREEYRRRLEGIVSTICSDHRRRNPTLLAPIAVEIKERVEELILAFLDAELEMMAVERVEGIEVRLEAATPEIDTVLVGTIDRISRNPGGYTLIDYKKKHVPSRGDLFSPQPVSMQMPFYIHLMEQNDRSVTRAAYYSFENKRYHFVFGGPKTNMASAEETGRSVEEVKRRIVEMRVRVSAGDFQIGSSPAANCSRCRLQEICRSGYSLDG